MKRHYEAFSAGSKVWNPTGFALEPRVCLVIERHTSSSMITYASSACRLLFNIESDQIEGKSLFQFIRADEMMEFAKHISTSDSSGTIVHLRFWFQSPSLPYDVPLEAVLMGSTDGIVLVMKKCKPFGRRKRVGNWEQYLSAHINVENRTAWSSHVDKLKSLIWGSTVSHNVTKSELKKIKIVDRNGGGNNVRLLEDIISRQRNNSDVSISAKALGIREYSREEFPDDDDDDDDDNDGDKDNDSDKLRVAGIIDGSKRW
jgi:hypothetical protein